MRVKTQRLLPGKDCRQQTLSHIGVIAERYSIKEGVALLFIGIFIALIIGIFLHESFHESFQCRDENLAG